MALIMWLMGKAGVEPTPEDFARYDREFRERGHHLTVDFGGQRVGGTRWTDDDWAKRPAIGLGYDYLVSRPYHGVGIEFLAQSLGPVWNTQHRDNSFVFAGGLAYYPIRPVRLFLQAGPEVTLNGPNHVVGRVGVGYRFMFFKLGMQPYAYAETRTDGQAGWGLNFRFEY